MLKNILSRLTNADHISVGWNYLISIAIFGLAGMLVGITLVFLTSKPTLLFFNPSMYTRLFTLHGNIMIHLFVIPVFAGVFGNLILPRMIGAKCVGLPKTNLLSWWLYILGAILMAAGLWVGMYDGGWTMQIPLTAMPQFPFFMLITGLLSLAVSAILLSINVLLTVHRRRAPEVTWSNMPIFVWTLYLAALVHVVILPERVFFLILQMVGSTDTSGFMKSAISPDSQLFQHLFWVASSPAVTVTILPVIGIISELLATFSRRGLFGKRSMVTAGVVFAALSLVVWGEHMIVGEQSAATSIAFSFLSMLQGILAGFMLIIWLATIFSGRISIEPPLWFAVTTIALWVIGGLAGSILATASLNVVLHSTAFVIGHTHFVLAGGVFLAILGGAHYWWPLITGYRIKDSLNIVALAITACGIMLTFIPYFFLGASGLPRRLAIYPAEFQTAHLLAAAGGAVLLCGVILFFFNMIKLRRQPTTPNPWRSNGYEWTQGVEKN